MITLREELTNIVSKAFMECGYDEKLGLVTVSDRPDLGQFQCNGSLSAAKIYKKSPMEIAQNVAELIRETDKFEKVDIVPPGFINITLKNEYLAEYIEGISQNNRYGCPKSQNLHKIVVDYGGANVAKPLHVGHLRAAIIGESLKRICIFLGHEVIGDVHLGDWGLQMGMIISELERMQPELVYFNNDFTGPYPEESPVTISQLEEMYPKASKLAKSDPEIMEQSRRATYELQNGRPGYVALWKHLVGISIEDLKKNYNNLNVSFELWLGESDSQPFVGDMVNYLKNNGYAYESEGALVVDVSETDDENDIPPFMVYKSDGSILYSTTDLATIVQRVKQFNPNTILYVVDNRQGTHFKQLFRCAYKTKIAPQELVLEHIGFGTMNGTDGKPYKTRDGGVMKLSDLIKIIEDKANEKINEANIASKFSEDEAKKIAQMVGISALKYADLSNYRVKDYIFDIDRFSSFEGKTGPYLLYSTVRIKSILRKAKDLDYNYGKILPPKSEVEKDLMLKIVEMPDVIRKSFEDRAPNQICEYVYELSTIFNRFYHDHRIITEADEFVRGSWLALLELTKGVMELLLDLLGIECPDRM